MKHRVGKAVTIAGVAVVAVAVGGFVVERLWNWLAPTVFGLKSISFLQALGLLVLSKILFGGFHRHGGGGRGWRRHMGERWAAMSPEEREKFRAGMRGRGRCGFGDASRPAPEQAQR